MRKDILNWKHKKGDKIWVPFLELFKIAPVSDEEFSHLVINSGENIERHEKSNYNPTRKCLNSIYNKDKFIEIDLREIDNKFLNGEKVNFKNFLARIEIYPMSQKTFNSLIESPNTTGDYDKNRQNQITNSKFIMGIANELHGQSRYIRPEQIEFFSFKKIESDLEKQILKSKKDNSSERKKGSQRRLKFLTKFN